LNRPYILDRDHCLIGEVSEQLDAFVRKGVDVAMGHPNRADRPDLHGHRHENGAMDATGAMHLAATTCRIPVLLDIGDVEHGAVQDAPKVIGFAERHGNRRRYASSASGLK
jgi:hypothetical protein